MPQQERNPKQTAVTAAAQRERVENAEAELPKKLDSSYEFSAEKGWPEDFRPVMQVDKGPHTEFVSTPSKVHREPVPALNMAELGAPATTTVTPLYQGAATTTSTLPTSTLPMPSGLPVPATAPLGTGTGGFKATVPPSPAHQASTAFLGSGSHQEMVLPLSEAAPELFGGDPAAATPHYDAIGAAPPSASAAIPYPVPRPQLPNATNAAALPVPTPILNIPRQPPISTLAAGGGAGNLGGFKATVPPSPAHAASTTILGSGGHQEMVLPLSEAAPELFGGNPAAATPHYDAIGAAGTTTAALPTTGLPPLAAAGNAPIVTPAFGGARSSNILPTSAAAAMTPTGVAATPSGFKATVPPSPAHQASTAYLSSGSHQEMVLPLSEAAPELFGGNPAAATPHYDAIGATTTNAPLNAGPTPIPVASGVSTVTPMASVARNLGGNTTNPIASSTPMTRGAAAATPSGFKATVPPSPAHQASTAYLSSGSHQEMVLPLSEAAPELFGGNPAAATPHYDAIGAAGNTAAAVNAPLNAAGPAPIPLAPGISTVTPMASVARNLAGNANPAATLPAGLGRAPAAPAGGISGFQSTVPPSPAHAASKTFLEEGGHQEMVLPLSEAAPELFGGNPAASTPHYDAVGSA